MIYLVLIGIIVYGAYISAKDNDKLKRQAEAFRSSGRKTFKDDNGVERSTETLEEVVVKYNDAFHGFHSYMVGKKSRKIYLDLTEEKVKKANERLKAEGKRYIWKEVQNAKDGYLPLWYAYDPEKELFVRCDRVKRRTDYTVVWLKREGRSFSIVEMKSLNGMEQASPWFTGGTNYITF